MIQAAVDVNTAREIFDLDLPDLGPYAIDYTKNGRFLLLGGRKGHLALLDALRMDIQMEVKDAGRMSCAFCRPIVLNSGIDATSCRKRTTVCLGPRQIKSVLQIR